LSSSINPAVTEAVAFSYPALSRPDKLLVEHLVSSCDGGQREFSRGTLPSPAPERRPPLGPELGEALPRLSERSGITPRHDHPGI
jgi:hypothetical protein